MLKYTQVQTPRGARDILPPDGYRKSLIESLAARRLEEWGYARIYTPSLEFYDALAQGNGPEINDQLYRFVDRDGATLALRPEMTTPVARVAATRYTEDDAPIRLYYAGSVFRYAEPQLGRSREFTQIGVELLGSAGPCADAEIVALAVSVFEAIGLGTFRVDLGHVGFFQGLLQGVDPLVAARLKEALQDRDYVRYEAMVKEEPLDPAIRTALFALPTLRGGAGLLAAARELAAGIPGALSALDELSEVYALVEAYGIATCVAVDLGMVKELDYYTGLLLEGYAPELGWTLCSGGRYDGLVGKFGRDCPAVGFAFGVERAMLALERQGWKPGAPVPDLVLWSEAGERAALFEAAAKARARALRVEIGIGCETEEDARRYARRRGIGRCGRARRNGGRLLLDLVDLEAGTAWSGSVDELAKVGST